MRACTPLTWLFLLSACIMFMSHRYFSSTLDAPRRRVVRHHSSHRRHHHGNSQPHALHRRDEEQGLEHADDDDDGDDADAGGSDGDLETQASTPAQDAAILGGQADEEDQLNEEMNALAVDAAAEGETSEEGEQVHLATGTKKTATDADRPSPGQGSAAATLASLVSLAKTSMAPYPDAADEFKCTPNVKARPTRK